MENIQQDASSSIPNPTTTMKRLIPLLTILLLAACHKPEAPHSTAADLPSIAVKVQAAKELGQK